MESRSIKVVAWIPKVCKIMALRAFGLCLEALGHCFTYFWGAGVNDNLRTCGGTASLNLPASPFLCTQSRRFRTYCTQLSLQISSGFQKKRLNNHDHHCCVVGAPFAVDLVAASIKQVCQPFRMPIPRAPGGSKSNPQFWSQILLWCRLWSLEVGSIFWILLRRWASGYLESCGKRVSPSFRMRTTEVSMPSSRWPIETRLSSDP